MTRSGRVEADPSDVLAPTFASIGDFRDDAIHVPGLARHRQPSSGQPDDDTAMVIVQRPSSSDRASRFPESRTIHDSESSR